MSHIIKCPMWAEDATHALELDLGGGEVFEIHYTFVKAIDLGWWSETDPKYPDGPTMRYWHSDWELRGFQIRQIDKLVGETFMAVQFIDEFEFEKLFRIAKAQAEREYETEND